MVRLIILMTFLFTLGVFTIVAIMTLIQTLEGVWSG